MVTGLCQLCNQTEETCPNHMQKEKAQKKKKAMHMVSLDKALSLLCVVQKMGKSMFQSILTGIACSQPRALCTRKNKLQKETTCLKAQVMLKA